MTSQNLSGYEQFCGGKFWDLNLTWYTDQPDFTPCFQNTVLVWIPCGFLFLVLPLYAYNLHTTPTALLLSTRRFGSSKIVLGILLVLLSLINLIKGIIDFSNNSDKPPVNVVSPAVQTATYIVAVILIHVERKKGYITSGVLFLFWLISFICGIVPFYSYILEAQDLGKIPDVFRFVMFYVWFAFILVQLVLSCFADRPPQTPTYSTRETCPEVSASFLSRITFWWINSLVYTGYKKTLEESDLWELNPRDVSKNVGPVFQRAWQDELDRTHWMEHLRPVQENGLSNRESQSSFTEKHVITSDEKTPLLNGPGGNGGTFMDGKKEKKKKQKEPSLAWVMVKCYAISLLQAHLCKFVCDILTFVGPMLQSLLIAYTESKDEREWKGFLYAGLFFVSAVSSSFFFHQLFHIGMTLGMRVKSAIIAAVYKKALTLSNEARKDTTVGEIVNLMSVDAQRMQDVMGYLWMMWSSPLQIAIAVYMLWGVVGPSTLAGLAVMILLIPVNGFLATIQRKLQVAQMTQKDQRIKLMNEVLNGIKVLKLYAWELSFQDKVNAIRKMELDTLRKYAYLSAVGTFTWTCAPFLVTLATFATYVVSGNTLDANTAFVSLSLFNILRFPINLLPMMISYIVTASVSLKRIGKFLKNGDIDMDNVQHDPRAEHPLEIKNGTFAWGTTKDDLPVLRDVNLHVKDHELIAVVGQVGAGKSSLVSAFLGEMEKLKGRVNVRGKVAYVAQQAWIQNASLRDNILFGEEFDAEKYDCILEACALKPDLEILPGGDQTEIGEKGINLSGGQKQRVNLARAVYSNADIILLDDPLSAVDSHVGKHIFDNVVADRGLLQGKTRVLVTHGIHWLPKVDRVVVLVNGMISELGTYDELLDHDGPFAQFLKTYLMQEAESSEEEDPEILEEKMKILQRVDSIHHEDVKMSSPSGISDSEGHSESELKRRLSRKKSTSKPERILSHEEERKKIQPATDKEKLIQEEKSQVGEVKWSVFFGYCVALGVLNSISLLIFFLLYQGSSVASNIWLSTWTEDPILKNTTIPTNTSSYINRRDLYLGVYGGLGGMQALFVLLYAIVSAVSMVRASGILHNEMLSSVLRSPMEFFDTTPMGRILNRFSRDIETIDNILPNLIRSWMNTFFTVISTIVVISYSTPIFLSVVLPLGILYFFVQRFYIPTSRQLKRVESTSRSPIYVHFSETITGASTIRAYQCQQRFIEKSDYLVDHNLVFYFASIASNRWLGLRLEFVGAAVVFCAAMFAVIGRDSLEGGLVGLSISYALQVTQSLNWMVRMTCDLETNVVSVERVKEYTETDKEADWYIDETRPPRSWPHEGQVVMEDYSTRYREGLDLVLRGISLNISGGEKVGIVGRTGAGKSSLTLSLFRIIEAAGGSIMLDGINISTLGLHQLRSKLTILPQDPVLFSGSLRMNLDPFDKFSDAQIWSALEHAHLKEFVHTLPAGLSYECGEGGQNLSVGQRQLLCLARTLLRKTKILILDEATAAVDLETDELIQQTIRAEFADCTIITIAHRLNTIMDNDRVLVLDVGKIKEFDSPSNLLKKKDSTFYGMAKDAGLVS